MEISKNLLNKIISRFQDNETWMEFLSLLLFDSNYLLIDATTFNGIPIKFKLFKNDNFLDKSLAFTSQVDGGDASSSYGGWADQRDGYVPVTPTNALDGGNASSTFSSQYDGGNAYSDYFALRSELPYGRYKILDGYFNYKSTVTDEIDYNGGVLYIGPSSKIIFNLLCLSSPNGIDFKNKVLSGLLPPMIDAGSFYNLEKFIYQERSFVQFLSASENSNRYVLRGVIPQTQRIFFVPEFIEVAQNDVLVIRLGDDRSYQPQSLDIVGYKNKAIFTTPTTWTVTQMLNNRISATLYRTNKFNYSNTGLPINVTVPSYSRLVNFVKSSIPSFIDCPIV